MLATLYHQSVSSHTLIDGEGPMVLCKAVLGTYKLTLDG